MKRKKKRSKPRKRIPRIGIGLCLIGLLLALAYYLFDLGPLPWKQPSLPAGRAIENTIELQIALARSGFSPGSIDGAMGSQTRQALLAFQDSRDLPATGEWSPSLDEHLRIEEPIYAYMELTSAALAKLTPAPSSWRERGELPQLGYHSILEMVAEKSSSHPDFIRSLNPQLNWATLGPGDHILAPLVPPYRIKQKIDEIQIHLQARQLQAFDSFGNLIFHCPVSIAREVEKRPVGELQVTVRVENPNYTFNPSILTTAAAREGIANKFIIQPGPNNPVGTVWLGLNLPSYGIHGTPSPEKVGRTESSGCFRLANWNAETLLAATEVGTPVFVLP
ncbi:MAG: L,D-transpeptidase family protein [Opitutales bacterium]